MECKNCGHGIEKPFFRQEMEHRINFWTDELICKCGCKKPEI